MSEPSEKRVKFTSNVSAVDRKKLFDEVYEGNPSLDMKDELFNKEYWELAHEPEPIPYGRYFVRLKFAEEIAKCETELVKIKAELAKFDAEIDKSDAEIAKREAAEAKFCLKAGKDQFRFSSLKNICNELGPLLFDLVYKEEELSKESKFDIVYKIKKSFENDFGAFKKLINILGLDRFYVGETIIPCHSDGVPFSPSSMNAYAQVTSFKRRQKHSLIYPFPFGETTHFPVFFCHPVFANLMDILHERNPSNPMVQEYKKFMEDNLAGKRGQGLDECLARLITTVLDANMMKRESQLVKEISQALKELFPAHSVKTNDKIKNNHSENQVGLAIHIGDFPFIIVEAKHESYSINAALQGFRNYRNTKAELIDNDPGFLITLDKGILYLYGIAKVTSRVVCTCLLSLEFSSYLFNVEDFSGTLYRCLSGLYFFYKQFEERISKGVNEDVQHQRYLNFKAACPYYDIKIAVPFPAISSVQSATDTNSRIEIESFETIIRQTSEGLVCHVYFKPCVYMVKTASGRNAVLKIAYNYDFQTHEKLSKLRLAPELIGYEKIYNRWHVILMEYLNSDKISYDNIYCHLNFGRNAHMINRNGIISSVKDILVKLQELGIVHGDFRASNILARRSKSDPSVLEDFKLIDFEFSGKVNEPYPFLALRNRDIKWHDGVNSYSPRQFEHDQYLFDYMCANELN
jgi:hypothetical protein